MGQRVSFLVDGFNLYHSVKDAQKYNGGVCCKWLNVRQFCESYLPLLGGDAALEAIYYFSALAHHLASSKPDVVQRHQLFIEALESTGIKVELGRFKPKDVWCKNCRTDIRRHEEKETDVAIAVRLLELALGGTCDTIVILTGDTDIAPAIRTAHRLAPTKRICVVMPFGRKNAELQQIVRSMSPTPGGQAMCFKVKATKYSAHLFADPLVLPDGRRLAKPASW